MPAAAIHRQAPAVCQAAPSVAVDVFAQLRPGGRRNSLAGTDVPQAATVLDIEPALAILP